MKSNRHAGQHNLHGKQYKMLSCKCCSVFNLKQEYLKREHTAERQQYLNRAQRVIA